MYEIRKLRKVRKKNIPIDLVNFVAFVFRTFWLTFETSF
jgi:hypothetical protein